MWIPASAAEVEHAATSGALEETASFDAKAALPEPKKNISLAIDVAAMATEGGVLLYGVGEDGDGRPTLAQPLALGGAAERVAQIVATSIAEVPHVDIRELPSTDDPSHGYLVVVVPQSPRAPHQVIVRGDGRFYGRGPKGNRVLSEGDVARLYDRRRQWQRTAAELLGQVVEAAPVEPRPPFGYVHGFVWPVVPDAQMFERLSLGIGQSGPVHQWLLATLAGGSLAGTYSPSLERAPNWGRHGAGVWRLSNLHASELAQLVASPDGRWQPDDLATLDVHQNGRLDAYCGRATDDYRQDTRVLLESIVAGTIESLLLVAQQFYEKAAYHGELDVGVAVTGLRGVYSYGLAQMRGDRSTPYPHDEYRATHRLSASGLHDISSVVTALLGPLFEASSGISGYSPLSSP